MPEGDTVRRTAARLHQALNGRELVRAELRWPDLGGVDLTDRVVQEVVAYGKHILIRLAPARGAVRSRLPTAPDGALTLHSHLRMDGQWFLYATGTRSWPSPREASVRAVLAGRDWTAVGHWLGMLDLVPTDAEGDLIGHLGPDIMADEFPTVGITWALRRCAAIPSRPAGAALLDQTAVAGIGTFYMAETLFAQRVSPWSAVSDVDLPAVLRTARRLLLRGVTQSIPNTTGDPRRGQGQYVHARSGRPCLRCGAVVRVAPIGLPPRDRPAFFCPVCQPGPAPTDDGRPRRPLGSGSATDPRRLGGLWRRRG